MWAVGGRMGQTIRVPDEADERVNGESCGSRIECQASSARVQQESEWRQKQQEDEIRG